MRMVCIIINNWAHVNVSLDEVLKLEIKWCLGKNIYDDVTELPKSNDLILFQDDHRVEVSYL